MITGVESGRVTAVVDIAALDPPGSTAASSAALPASAARPKPAQPANSVEPGACRSDAVAETRRRVAILPAEAAVTLTAIY